MARLIDLDGPVEDPLRQTQGKNNVNFCRPDERSLEVKLDVRSQCTGYGCIEYPTIKRGADLILYSFTYARVYTGEELEQLYYRNKIASVGEDNYEARVRWQMGKYGKPPTKQSQLKLSLIGSRSRWNRRNPLSPSVWLDAAAKLMVLPKNSAARAKLIVEASDEYREARQQEVKIESVHRVHQNLKAPKPAGKIMNTECNGA